MMEISCIEIWEKKVNLELVQECLKNFLSMLFVGQRTVSLYITGDEEIQKLNLEYRGKDRPTDVLSWSYLEEERDEFNFEDASEEPSELVGELVLSGDRVQAQAEENGWDLDTELIRLLAHGCAHIAGWDHEQSEDEAAKMLQIEIELLEGVGYKGLYPSNS